MKKLYTLSEDYLMTDVEDGIILMPLSSEKIKKERFFSTDGIGAIVLNMLKENKNVDEIIDSIVSEFDAAPEIVRSDMYEFLSDLEKEGIII